MTIDKDFKKLIRAHMLKTGKSFSAARADLLGTKAAASKGGNGVQLSPFPHDDVVGAGAERLGVSVELAKSLLAASADEELAPVMRFLQVTTPFGVVTRRQPATGQSAVAAIAAAQAVEAAASGAFFAESGGAEQLTTQQISEKLIRYGAADGIRTQVFRSFRNDDGKTFSKQCRGCQQWIWLGETERQAKCVCGQVYRVVFDLADVYRWTGTWGQRCMNCGKEHTEPKAGDGWVPVNDWQSRCDKCSSEGRRSFEVYCDYETSEHAGARGMFQVIELTENEEDVTDLVDQGIHFVDLNHLRRYLKNRLGGQIEIEEIH